MVHFMDCHQLHVKSFSLLSKNNDFLTFRMISRSVSAAHCCHKNITYTQNNRCNTVHLLPCPSIHCIVKYSYLANQLKCLGTLIFSEIGQYLFSFFFTWTFSLFTYLDDFNCCIYLYRAITTPSVFGATNCCNFIVIS